MWLLLDINMNLYMERLTEPLDLTLGDLERSKSRSPRFQSLVSHNGAKGKFKVTEILKPGIS